MAMKNPVHPGEILREDVLADFGLSVGEAASRLGISRVALSRVLHGHARISPNLACAWRRPASAPPAPGWPCSQPTTWPSSVPPASPRCASSTTSPELPHPPEVRSAWAPSDQSPPG
jgi:addiction module HigA family antidote